MPVCYICRAETPHTHEHHVTMQSKTGDRGPVVDLCGDCHTQIHTVAKARYAKLRGGKPNPQNLQWFSRQRGADTANAELLISALVQIELTMQEVEQPRMLSLRLPVDLNRGLELLIQETGQSKVNTLLACLRHVLTQKGLLHK